VAPHHRTKGFLHVFELNLAAFSGIARFLWKIHKIPASQGLQSVKRAFMLTLKDFLERNCVRPSLKA